MAELIGLIIIIFIVVWIVACIVWIVQWVLASIIWGLQVFLMPFVVYFAPAIFILLLTASIYWGGWVAAHNYFSSLVANVKSEDLVGKLTRNYIITILTAFLVLLYISFAIYVAESIYTPGQKFISNVIEHYGTIEYPAFHINFPFWDK